MNDNAPKKRYTISRPIYRQTLTALCATLRSTQTVKGGNKAKISNSKGKKDGESIKGENKKNISKSEKKENKDEDSHDDENIMLEGQKETNKGSQKKFETEQKVKEIEAEKRKILQKEEKLAITKDTGKKKMQNQETAIEIEKGTENLAVFEKQK